MFDILHDIRDAFRSARRQPGVTLVIILTLAVGIGASTAIFTYFVELYWYRLDAPDAERMYYVTTGTAAQRDGRTSYPNAQIYREALADLGELVPWGIVYSATPTVPEEGSRPGKTFLRASSAVSPEHFDFFGVRFTLGRDFLPEEHQGDGPPVVVIDHTFWNRHMGADPEVLGRPLRLNGHTFTVVGVTPRGFDTDGWPHAVYVPAARYDDLAGAAVLADREARRFKCLLRLKEGVRPEEAEARLAVVAKNLDREYPWPEGAERRVTVSRIDSMSFDLTDADIMMAGAVGLLLLLTCANVANLLLARAIGRRREIAVLAALGASQGRIARRLLTESGLLALAGGTLGLLLARWLLAVIRLYHVDMAFGAAHYWEGKEWMRYDDRVLGFTLLVVLVTGCLFGLAPIFHAARTDLVSALKSGSAENQPGRRLGARHLLVIAQVALATTLLLLAGLLMRSLRGLENRDLGFETERQLMVALVARASPIPPSGDSAQHREAWRREAWRREAWRDLYEAGRQRLAAFRHSPRPRTLLRPSGPRRRDGRGDRQPGLRRPFLRWRRARRPGATLARPLNRRGRWPIPGGRSDSRLPPLPSRRARAARLSAARAMSPASFACPVEGGGTDVRATPGDHALGTAGSLHRPSRPVRARARHLDPKVVLQEE
jgi:putative ABC transport system permease protein